jgi:ubiquitin-conjugating enzyme E2 variant
MWVRALQRIGLMQSRGHHGVHHRAPYAIRFCPMTNYLNPVLDRMQFWRTVERALVACGATVVRCTPARAGF